MLEVDSLGQSPNLANDFGGRVSLFDRNANDLPAARLYGVASDDGVFGPVGAFDENVRLNGLDDLSRGVFREDHHAVDAFERSENLCALLLVVDWPLRSFVAANRGIRIEPDDQHIA